jgi:hypothetical protein
VRSPTAAPKLEPSVVPASTSIVEPVATESASPNPLPCTDAVTTFPVCSAIRSITSCSVAARGVATLLRMVVPVITFDPTSVAPV